MTQVFVSDWKDAWKWLSVNIGILIAILNGLDQANDLNPFLHHWMGSVNIVLGIAVGGGRIINQGGSTIAPVAQGAKP